ncbi:hypothetical protein IE077_000148 [Cardiosporidium cionae]|uniref:SURP motif domain-containing protein n=1 Tax=Cardiosporidium cionae TaxID=476202 RepID=A0ABQ7JD69_9APIC|nr:hypothetical protein IE077_000148 [Cardiosporidium cionae]|eukprot:KAF8821921.1 hypothetical protein IE077_000148 [Cardiosporidium cionae]
MAFSAVPPPADLLAPQGGTTTWKEKNELEAHFKGLLAELDLPEDASYVLPTHLKEQLVIEHTAQFVRREGDRVEFRLKLDDDLISQFPFLHVDHPLHPYYAYLKRTGKMLYTLCPQRLPAALLPFYSTLYDPSKLTHETSSVPHTAGNDSTPSSLSTSLLASHPVPSSTSSSVPLVTPVEDFSPPSLSSLSPQNEDVDAQSPTGAQSTPILPRSSMSHSEEGGLDLLLSAYGDESSSDDLEGEEDEEEGELPEKVPLQSISIPEKRRLPHSNAAASSSADPLAAPTLFSSAVSEPLRLSLTPSQKHSETLSSRAISFSVGKATDASEARQRGATLDGKREGKKAEGAASAPIKERLMVSGSAFPAGTASSAAASLSQPSGDVQRVLQKDSFATTSSIGSEAIQSGVVYIKFDSEPKNATEVSKNMDIVPICWKAPTPELKILPEHARIIQEIGHCLLKRSPEIASFCFEPCEDSSLFFFLKMDTIEERFFKYVVQSIQNFMKSENFAPPPDLSHPLHPTTDSYVQYLEKQHFIACKKKELMERLRGVSQLASISSAETEKEVSGDQALQEERRKHFCVGKVFIWVYPERGFGKRARMVIQSIQKSSSTIS